MDGAGREEDQDLRDHCGVHAATTATAADRNAARSIICFKKDEDKVTVLDSHKIMGSSGALAAS